MICITCRKRVRPEDVILIDGRHVHVRSSGRSNYYCGPLVDAAPSMKALSIQQPWADLIVWGGKDIENRSWRLPNHMVGQRIHVHAGKRLDRATLDFFNMTVPAERLGALLGTVKITGCVTESDSEWFSGPYGFTLADPAPHLHPIPCRGRLGFFQAPGHGDT